MIRLAAVPHGASREDRESVSEEQQYAGRHAVVTGGAGSPASKRRNLRRPLGHPAFRLVEGDLVTPGRPMSVARD